MDGVPFIMAVVLLCYVLLSFQLSGMTKELRKRLDAQDDRLSRIAERLGVPAPEIVILPAVQEALASGQRIRAVKLYREATGTDLKSAKRAVDAIVAHGTQDRS